jgi:hypothetical protein
VNIRSTGVHFLVCFKNEIGIFFGGLGVLGRKVCVRFQILFSRNFLMGSKGMGITG